jgi:UDP-N-acetylmuramyl pentapeptide phosphotransferase/UDP-N-acetylglucosamine-1-phosphate transferase
MLMPVVVTLFALLAWNDSVPRLMWLGPLAPAMLVGLLSLLDDRFDLSRMVRVEREGARGARRSKLL